MDGTDHHTVPTYAEGTDIIHTTHGAGKIVCIEQQEYGGKSVELYVISFEERKMTLRVAANGSGMKQLRAVGEASLVEMLIKILSSKPASKKGTMWSTRAVKLFQKIISGDLKQVAEVVRDLYHQPGDPASLSETNLYQKALHLLVGELGLMLGGDTTKALAHLKEECPEKTFVLRGYSEPDVVLPGRKASYVSSPKDKDTGPLALKGLSPEARRTMSKGLPQRETKLTARPPAKRATTAMPRKAASKSSTATPLNNQTQSRETKSQRVIVTPPPSAAKVTEPVPVPSSVVAERLIPVQETRVRQPVEPPWVTTERDALPLPLVGEAAQPQPLFDQANFEMKIIGLEGQLADLQQLLEKAEAEKKVSEIATRTANAQVDRFSNLVNDLRTKSDTAKKAHRQEIIDLKATIEDERGQKNVILQRLAEVNRTSSPEALAAMESMLATEKIILRTARAQCTMAKKAKGRLTSELKTAKTHLRISEKKELTARVIAETTTAQVLKLSLTVKDQSQNILLLEQKIEELRSHLTKATAAVTVQTDTILLGKELEETRQQLERALAELRTEQIRTTTLKTLSEGREKALQSTELKSKESDKARKKAETLVTSFKAKLQAVRAELRATTKQLEEVDPTTLKRYIGELIAKLRKTEEELKEARKPDPILKQIAAVRQELMALIENKIKLHEVEQAELKRLRALHHET